MVQGLTQATFLTPPMDVRAKRDGFALIYNLNELDVPSIYSSMFTNSKGLKERPAARAKIRRGIGRSDSLRRKESG